MKIAHALMLGSTLALALSACAGGQQRRGPPPKVIAAALKGAPGEAQPSTIVKTEIAYARAAWEDGQHTAGLEFVAPGAKVHLPGGPSDAVTYLESLPDPEVSVQWAPRTVVMSCRGDLAVSIGRFRDQEDFVGNFVTVWARQPGNVYKWTYEAAGRDNPQPPPRKVIEDGDIVVTAIDSIKGLVATCPRPGDPVPAPPAIPASDSSNTGSEMSRDGTLRWRWEHWDDGSKTIAIDYYYNGEWTTPVQERLASDN